MKEHKNLKNYKIKRLKNVKYQVLDKKMRKFIS